MASNATTAIGTTTAMALVPDFESPVVDVAERAVEVGMDELVKWADELARPLVEEGEVVVGWKVLVEVCVIVTTSPPSLVVGLTTRLLDGVVVEITGGGVVVGSCVVVGGGGGACVEVLMTEGDDEEVVGVRVGVLDIDGVEIVMLVSVCVETTKSNKC
jgi:hypothetical protein